MSRPYEDFDRECARVTEVMTAAVVDAGIDKQADIELHALEHHFFRNKAAYIVGRISGKGLQIPFVIPMLHTEDEASPAVYLDACLLGSDIISKLFSFTRTYFMVDASIPSQYVLFLQQLMPRKAVSEIYSCIGHHRHGKTYYFRTATVICARPRTRLFRPRVLRAWSWRCLRCRRTSMCSRSSRIGLHRLRKSRTKKSETNISW